MKLRHWNLVYLLLVGFAGAAPAQLAESFKVGVEALIETSPSEEEIDDYIERFASLMQQPVILH